METILSVVLIGAGATVVMDLWVLARKRLLGVPAASYGLVGRWIAHYVIGIAFAAALLAIWGCEWARHPALGPALAVGIGSVAAPFLVMQPGMGAGVAASRTPRPNAARLQSFVTHAVFGLGLYGAGWLTRILLDLRSAG